jgi:hypothetical protein
MSAIGTDGLIVHHGGCNCRRVRFEVDAPASPGLLDCNCSICTMTGYLHLIVPASHFRLQFGAEALTEYTFNTGAAKHLFCRHCGIKSFYIPRSHPDRISINARCLEAGTLFDPVITLFDDNDRDAAMASIAHIAEPQA